MFSTRSGRSPTILREFSSIVGTVDCQTHAVKVSTDAHRWLQDARSLVHVHIALDPCKGVGHPPWYRGGDPISYRVLLLLDDIRLSSDVHQVHFVLIKLGTVLLELHLVVLDAVVPATDTTSTTHVTR